MTPTGRYDLPAILAVITFASLMMPGPRCGLLALSTIGTSIKDQGGNTLVLRGANWFGFNDGATMVRDGGRNRLVPSSL